MNPWVAFTAYCLQILIVAGLARLAWPLLSSAPPRIRAWFWSVSLLVSLASPWMTAAVAPIAPDAPGGVFVIGAAQLGRSLDAAEPRWRVLLFLGFVVVAVVRLVRLGTGVRRLHALGRAARVLPAPLDWPGLRLLETDGVRVPAASFLHQAILVPSGFAGLPEAWRRAVINHEVIHLRRGHGLLLVLEEILLIPFWFHPPVWFLVRRCREAREEMVDAMTVEAVGRPAEYRLMLISLSADLPFPAPAVSGTTALRSRIQSLVTLENNPMPTPSPSRLTLAAALLVSGTALAGAAAPLATPPARHAQTKVETTTTAPRAVVSRVSPVYPEDLKKNHIQGFVALSITIDADGKVTSAMARKDDNPDLGKAAIAAIRQWRFESGPGPAKMTYAFSFRTNEK